MIFILINIAKFAIWTAFIPMYVHLFGIWLGVPLFVFSAVGWNIYNTAAGNYRRQQDPWPVLKRQWKARFVGLFVDFGNFLGPKWGRDSDNRDLKPTCGLDEVAYYHDRDMEFAKALSTADARRKAKNAGDWAFIKGAWTADNTCHGFYVFGGSVGFLFRIIGRSVVK